jgi:hypothetical protein
MPWDKRSDARYCSARCRQGAYDAFHARVDVLDQKEILEPPDDFESTRLDYTRWTWSNGVRCDRCHRFTKVQISMKRSGVPPTRVFVCSWKCLGEMLDF